jgi:putative methyltransferase
MKTIKVVFYSPPGNSANYSALNNENIFVNPTPYYLHSYFKVNYPLYKDMVQWAPSIIHTATNQELISYIKEQNANILCVSLYLWNVRSIFDQIKAVKDYFQDSIKIVAGGPSCDAVNQDWYTKYPFIDHYVIGQGEKAWASLALDFIGARQISSEDSNIVHFIKNKDDIKSTQTSYNYEFVRGIHFSPYRECEDLVVELIEFYKTKPNVSLAWIYETSRGCPFHCTFCDWNGGQSNKTQKRKINFLDDIDFMAKHQMYNLYLADANFGMWEDDLAITKRVIEHNQNGHEFKYYLYNLNKNFSNTTKEILELIIKYKLSRWWIKLSAQDVNKDVLDAIHRPGSWEDQKNFAHSMYRKYNESHGLKKIYVEIIVGLPGQSLKSYLETLNEIYSNGFVPRSYSFHILVNAPVAYDADYKEKYKVESGVVFDIIDMKPKQNSVLDVYNASDPEIMTEMVLSTSTASERDIVTMMVFDQLYRALLSRTKWPAWGWIDVNWKYLKALIDRLVETNDFKIILETRISNFSKYRINAMDSASGKILVGSADMHSLVARNWGIVEDTMKDCPDKEKFLETWSEYNYAKDFLNF